VVFNLASGAIALLTASVTGHLGGDGGGTMLVAPELLGPAAPLVKCGHEPSSEPRELTFEMLDPADHQELPRLMAEGSHHVAFEWHESTGELTLAGATGAMFSDLGTAATTQRIVALRMRSCGSR
jgi:hypothetical protein